MQAAQILAGYSLGDADLLRRAMGKKIQSEMDAQRARFVEGCATHNEIPAAKANELFDLIDKFAGYGFNKSHAAAYALLAYQTAWLKAHHRAEFYAASMSFDMALTDKLGDLRRGHAPRRRSSACRRTSTPARRYFTVEDGARPLRARRAQGRRREGDGSAGRGAGARRAVRQPRGFRRAHRSAAAQPPPARKPRRRAARSTASSPTAPRCSPAAETILAHAASAHEQRDSGQAGLFGVEFGRSRADPPAARRVMDAGAAHGGRARGVRLLFLGASGRCRAASACRAQGPDLRRARRYPHRRGRTRRRDDGRRWSRTSRWRTSAKGRRYMMASLSATARASSIATVFDDDADQRRSKRPRKAGAAACSASSSTAVPATMRRASRSSASSRSPTSPSGRGCR